MSTNTLHARLIPLHDIEENWDKVSDFIPKLAEPVIFDPDDKHPYSRTKIGDGKTLLHDLKFTVEEEIYGVFNQRNGVIYFDGGEIATYKEPEVEVDG